LHELYLVAYQLKLKRDRVLRCIARLVVVDDVAVARTSSPPLILGCLAETVTRGVLPFRDRGGILKRQGRCEPYCRWLMGESHMTYRTLLRLGVGGAVFVALVVVWRLVAGGHAFDPDELAGAETRMWQAYYSGDTKELGLELVHVLRTQFGMSLLESGETGLLLARASMRFRSMSGGYEANLVPELTEVYRHIQESTGASFDPREAAEAELSWWVARRTPGEDSPEQVGRKIADLYAVLYGGAKEEFVEAGTLRARAAALRDAGGPEADWVEVESLLRQSYRTLVEAL
jgi:hypothetical protein